MSQDATGMPDDDEDLTPLKIMVMEMRARWKAGDGAVAASIAKGAAPYMHARVTAASLRAATSQVATNQAATLSDEELDALDEDPEDEGDQDRADEGWADEGQADEG